MKNWFARIFLFVLLIAVGAWWHHAAQSEDYGSIEQTWYIVGFVFVLALNIGNGIADYRQRARNNTPAAKGGNATYLLALLFAASLINVACRRYERPVSEQELFKPVQFRTDSGGWEVPVKARPVTRR